MIRVNWLRFFGGVLIGVLVLGMPAMATTIKSASHYGPFDSLGPADCFAAQSACEAFQATGQTVSVNGNNFTLFQFSSGPNTPFIDFFDFGAITADTLVTLPSLNGGILTCGDGDQFGPGAVSQAFDSGNETISGLQCTPIDQIAGLPLAGGSTLYSTVDAFGNAVAFTINANGSIRFNSDFTDVVFFLPGVAPVATPEPASLALLGTGLATLIVLKRRK